MKTLHRCAWAESDPLLRTYHDEEWGVPQYDSRMLWEMLMLEGFQAGLSWLIILRKREAFREAFANFDPEAVAKFNEDDVARLLQNPGIIRSRAKIQATIAGAGIYLTMQQAGEDFSKYVWAMAGGKPLRNTSGIVPAKSELSETFSTAFKKRGFKFVGPVIVYAWMQATGILNDHSRNCFRRNAGRTK
jgi:DNA-3-methyladenine glycosylase I